MKGLIVIVLICLHSFSAAWANGEFFESYIVVVNSNIGITTLSKGDLKKIYIGHKTHINGKRLNPCILGEISTLSDEFYSFVGMGNFQYARYWTERVLSGDGLAPVHRATVEKVISFIEDSPNAIGFLPTKSAKKFSDKITVVDIK